MNRFHRWFCRSGHWKRSIHEILSWAMRDLDLGNSVLEVGPGPGVSTDWLLQRTETMDCLEIDTLLARAVERRLGIANVRVRCGDASAMPYPDRSFSAVVSFMMLHHMPTPGAQDQFFSEALRVLRPGGVLLAVDSLPSVLMRIVHLGDTMVLVNPDTAPQRLASVGFQECQVEIGSHRFRSWAWRPLMSIDHGTANRESHFDSTR
jgi:ubiquinone/menaquinone biosynthesis C-methylase UbiE